MGMGVQQYPFFVHKFTCRLQITCRIIRQVNWADKILLVVTKKKIFSEKY